MEGLRPRRECQGLLTKLSEERFRINELTLRCLPERLFEGSFLVRGQFEGLVLFRNEDGNRGPLFEGVSVELQLAFYDFSRRDYHGERLANPSQA